MRLILLVIMLTVSASAFAADIGKNRPSIPGTEKEMPSRGEKETQGNPSDKETTVGGSTSTNTGNKTGSKKKTGGKKEQPNSPKKAAY